MTKRIELDEHAIVEAYRSGTSVLHIAERHGTSRRTIVSRLEAHGVPLRGMREQKLIFYEGTTAEERKLIAKPAHDAIRGKARPLMQKLRTASAHEAAGRMTSYERIVEATMRAAGHASVPQMAIGIFNADLAVPEIGAVVEVDPGWHSSARKRAQDARKNAVFKALGILVVRVAIRHGKPLNTDDVIAALDRRRRSPSAIRKHGVLWRRLQRAIADGDLDQVASMMTA